MLQSTGSQTVRTTEHTHTRPHTHTYAKKSENLLEMQIFRPYPGPSKSEESGGGGKGQNTRSQYNSSFLQTEKKNPRKVFNQIQHPFIIKSLSKLGLKGNFCNVIRDGQGLPWWSSVWDSALPRQGAQVRPLAREADCTCHNLKEKKRFCTPQRRPNIPCATTKTSAAK